MLSLKSSDEIAYNGSNNCARMDLFADTAADLTGVTTFDSIVLLAGSSALDISTGDLYRMQSDGTWILQPGTGAFSNVYTKAEIDAMIANYYTKSESDDLYEWITATITTDTLPLTFIADGSPLISWSVLGNGSQTGMPTPDNPIQPEFVGTLDDSDWTIPISCGGETTTVNLAQTNRTRKIIKRVLDGSETWSNTYGASLFGMDQTFNVHFIPQADAFCTHYTYNPVQSGLNAAMSHGEFALQENMYQYRLFFKNTDFTSPADFQSWIASEYSAGHPVTVWYVRETAAVGMINEPLAKIGDYSDELSSTVSGVTIPTAKGSNTLIINTTLQPSEITITGKIRET